MNIRLLGTGAADGIPGFYSNDEVSKFARQHGGKDMRTRSAALVDGILKIDLPPDTICQMQLFGLNATDWTALFFTHSHEDHFAVSEIQYELFPFVDGEELPFTIYGNSTIGEILKDRYPDWPIEFVELRSFCEYVHAEYVVTPIPALHKADEECHNLLFETKDRSLLYATDTGIWEEPTFAFLAQKRLDCLIIECTEGYRKTTYKGHLNFEDLGTVLERLRQSKTIDALTKVYTTHHAHTGGARHCDIERELAPLYASPGYDGLLVSF